jgi:FSR family fosmidomycin resistance protein-like MFS transporter
LFGLAFGLGGVGAALIGQVADVKGIEFVFRACSLLPALGLLAAFLPHIETGGGRGRRAAEAAPAVDVVGTGA